MKKTAIITGVNGQDGSYLAELLVSKGYQVHGTKRRSSTVSTGRLSLLLRKDSGTDLDYEIVLHHADVTDSSSINRLIDMIEPSEIYNLAAQSHVAVSFEEPEYTANSDALGCLRILEAIRRQKYPIKFYQASTSELFGGQSETPYNELSALNPRSPYGAAKAYAYYITKQYREAYGLFACNGILFNHESPRRGENFVSKKIINGIKAILNSKQNYIALGNLNASRDWGHARDYVDSMWRILNHTTADDWVIATGVSHTIRDFCRKAFRYSGVEIEFVGDGLDERGVVIRSSASALKPGKEVIKVDKRFFRPLEVDYLNGDASKARQLLGWAPRYDLDSLIQEMLND
jgi:GDPmannose 4,6-dehydratase